MSDSEKITINLNAVELGKIDLLVQESLYNNRTDFIRTAIRNQLDKHAYEIQQSVVRHSFVVGALIYGSKELQKYKEANEKIKIDVIGFLQFNSSVTPELALETIESIKVHGIFKASEALKEALADRIL